MKINNKDGSTSYRIDYYDMHNKRRYKTFKLKTEAKAWKEDMESLKRRDPALLSAINQKIAFIELFNRWFDAKIKNKRARKTIIQYQGHNSKHFKRFHTQPIYAISSYEVELWLSELVTKGLKPKSINNVLILLKQIFKYAHDQGIILKNPLREVATIPEPETEVNYFNKEEVRAILNANRYEPIYPILVFVLNCGVRVGELAGLCWDCINFANRQILIKRSVSRGEGLKEYTKTKRIRYVPMNDQVYEVLNYLQDNKTSSTLVFANHKGEPIDPDHYSSRQFKEALIRAGIEPRNFHKTRHTFASHFVMNGGNIFDLQKLLGHTDIETTQIYAHLSPNHLLEASKIVNFESEIEPRLKNDFDGYKLDTRHLRLVR